LFAPNYSRISNWKSKSELETVSNDFLLVLGYFVIVAGKRNAARTGS
jgi:hypothetical protein